ncbi:TPA: hypothetical protein ON570_004866 [Citrobacter werkmanii]|nr:hypothetical protein [Citrobacter werkmanii]
MNTENKKDVQHNGIVYSTEWVKAIALKYLCGHAGNNKNSGINIARDIQEVLFLLNEKSPDWIVLDIPARDYVSLLCHIRRQYPALPVIITQSRILFSDRAVASWFGNIWLREYNCLMAGYPGTPVSACVTDPRFAGTSSAAACVTECQGNPCDGQVLNRMERWLCGRLSERMTSGRCARVVTGWLSHGISPRDAGSQLRRSEKLMYYYRWRVMQELGISGHPANFIPSLSLKEGPVSADRPGLCRMRLTRTDIHP